MTFELEKDKDKKRKAQVSKMLSAIMPNKDDKTPEAAITIDFPLNKATLAPQHYAVRITSTGGSAVELSIDGGDWQGCRENAGHSWFDWHNIPQGSHKLVARMKVGKNKFEKSKAVSCKVK